MPIYVYELCEGECKICGGSFELRQPLDREPCKACPLCRKPVRRIITGVNDFTLTAFTQTHYYRDQIIPLIFGAFGTEGTDATIGGDVEWLLSDHWSARVGVDAFLGKQHQHDLATFATFCKITPSCAEGQTFQPFSETAFGAGHMQAGGAERNVMDEFWTRIRYRF